MGQKERDEPAYGLLATKKEERTLTLQLRLHPDDCDTHPLCVQSGPLCQTPANTSSCSSAKVSLTNAGSALYDTVNRDIFARVRFRGVIDITGPALNQNVGGGGNKSFEYLATVMLVVASSEF